MTENIRVGSKWIKKGKGKTIRTLIRVDNTDTIGKQNIVYFHSDTTGTHYQWTEKNFLAKYKKV